MDTDGDGKITPGEFDNFKATAISMNEEHIKALLEAYDIYNRCKPEKELWAKFKDIFTE